MKTRQEEKDFGATRNWTAKEKKYTRVMPALRSLSVLLERAR
jgi:hypothetical protein